MLQTRIPTRTVAAALARAPLHLPRRLLPPSARPFSTTRRARLQLESAPFSSPPDSLRDRLADAADTRADPQFKVEAWPLLLSRERAVKLSEVAAATAINGVLGLRMGLHHLAMRFFDYAGLKPHVKMVAFKAVYIPVWFVDLSASASAVMGEESYNLTIESMRIPIPGFNLPPLSSMPLQLPEGVPTFRWNGGDVDPSIQTIPFTRHPLNIPQKLKSLPRRVARDEDDVGFDPSRAKFRMVANYATYIPVYLGEWEVESTEFESGTTRVTTCIFADSHKPRFCMYRQKTPDSDPEWTPAPASTFTVTISARPASISLPGFRDVATAKHMQKVFGARLQAAIDEIKKERQEMGDGFVEWTDVVPEGGIVGFVADQDRVCSYKTWEAINEAYTEALEQCEIASEFHDRLKEMPTSRMAIIRPSLRSPVQRADNSQFFDIVKDSVDKWRELVEDSKPDWLRKAEENEKSVVGRETSKIRTKERGRLTK